MKNILFAFLLISTTLFAQQTDKKWENVIAFENEGKVKSANDAVAEIYKKAIAQKDEVQMIKCFFYQSKYLQVVDENAQTKILNNLKKEINSVSTPSKAILNLVYANCLTDYYSNNRYNFYNRTNTIGLDDDFMTWSENSFIEQIDKAYKKSFENETILKNTLLTKYESVFDYATENDFSNQTVYDYVLKENINYYFSKITEFEANRSDFIAYKKQLLGNATDFIKLNFDFVKNENLRTVLSLYQKQEANFPTAENRWERMQFCKKNLIDYDDNYISSLNNFQKTVKDEKLIQKIQLKKALYFAEFASKTRTPDYNIKAVALIDSILANNNHSNAYKLALQKKQQIKSKQVYIQLLQNSYQGENTRASITYTNINNLKVSFYKITQQQLAELAILPPKSDILAHKTFEKQQPIVSKSYTLLHNEDYFSHSTELLLPQLEKGSYMAYFESDSDIKNGKAFAFDFITISNISVLATKEIKNNVFQILDRKTGYPIENVTIKLPLQSLKTDQNGIASYERVINNEHNDEMLIFSTPGDTLSIGKRYLNQIYNYSNNGSEEKIRAKVQFYLDRAIYRPGQTVFYKGIVVQKDKDKTTVVPNVTLKIKVQNPNYKDFKEIDVHTNEFGSFSGEFVLPTSERTGSYVLKTAVINNDNKNFIEKPEKETTAFWNNVAFENSYIDFKVEEYKRPKFEAAFVPVRKTFRINQKVTVTGLAKAFAGSNLSDANVKYEVRLKPFILERGNYYYKNGKTEMITVGETKTDASGKFEISFTAKPFEDLTAKGLPIFSYQVKATVTDINGETHDAFTTIKVGYHDLILGIIAPYNVQTKNKEEIKLTSTNLNGDFLAAKGEVKIYLLYPASTKFKKRIFNEPEIASISPQDFEKLFPYEENEKAKIENTPETLVYSKKINTEKDKKIVLDFISNYKTGNYKIVFTAKDSFGNLIETKSNFSLFQNNDKFVTSTLFTSEQINKEAKKDGYVLVKLKSVIPELYIAAFGNYENKKYFEDHIQLKNHEAIIKIPIKNEFENGMNVSFQSIFENENYTNETIVPLEKIEKKIELDIETFRNKMDPGSTENWSFKLKFINTKNEAEVLASMYDSSLDQFNKRDWAELKFSNYTSNSGTYKTTLGFEKTYSYIQNLNSALNRI
ncbi:MG2 domain-containing protein [Flavobacterium sp. KJJ]|uniref:MG2 domain-containing protein n=1 Tax=Flavobacterium sp. KJJ TaxID=1270193 RepID=UPI0004930D86|nr:MG2 domain-containing protein [Flavobacterium sp. KJJ]